MKKARILLIIAIWTALLPYLGFPNFWKNLLFAITGLAIAYISYIIYRETKPKETIEKKVFDNFSENSHEQYLNEN
jgi:4-amino-4-deoxy-L-arabinose transferase-like glycosyltransferase